MSSSAVRRRVPKGAHPLQARLQDGVRNGRRRDRRDDALRRQDHQGQLDAYLRPLDRVAELLRLAGFVTYARLLREPDEDGVEKRQRADLLARKPATSAGHDP